MKIAILGTKGIPNNYGGYEQFAEYISVRLVNQGHEVTVYNPSFHPFADARYNGVEIIRKYSPENLLGGAANFVYDFLCLRDALSRDFDVIYEAGYHSVALSMMMLRIRGTIKPVIITNMDGLEYRRSKWNGFTRMLIRAFEKIAVRESPFLIADNLGIQEHYRKNFSREPFYLPYGADLVTDFSTQFLTGYGVNQFEYYILVARLEPENNIEEILDGYVASSSPMPFIVIGNHQTAYGRHLMRRYTATRVQLVGGVYRKDELDSLRHFSLAYFHGHSVGGTNPSLLEAMACGAFIVAHDNPFNRSVLVESAYYFKNSTDVKDIIEKRLENESERESFVERNRSKIIEQYNWDSIVKQHEQLFRKLLQRGREGGSQGRT